MNIIDEYNELGNKVVEEAEDIKKYEDDLKGKRARITSLLKGEDLTVFLNPLRLIRLTRENKRLRIIGKTLDNLKKSTVLHNMDEESGNLQEDLYNSAYYFKPNRIRLFMKQNRIYDESRDKKLSLVKK